MIESEVIEGGFGPEETTKASENEHSLPPLEAINASPGFKALVQKTLWHGGSVYDAWFNAVSGQVGQVILSMPYSYSQMGFGLGIFFHLLYATIGIWTCYMLACLYLEYRSRKEKEGVDFKRHIIQACQDLSVYLFTLSIHIRDLKTFSPCYILSVSFTSLNQCVSMIRNNVRSVIASQTLLICQLTRFYRSHDKMVFNCFHCKSSI